MEDKKILLSVKDLHVKFKVRGRTLSAIRGISLDFYENESVAIVGESGSGKSVFTKTFAGMLDSNGYIDEGSIYFNDPELSDTRVKLGAFDKFLLNVAHKRLNKSARLEAGAQIYQEITALKQEKKSRQELTNEENEALTDKLAQLQFERTELFNARQTLDPKKEKAQLKEAAAKLKEMDKQIEDLQKKRNATVKARKAAAKKDTEYLSQYNAKLRQLRAQHTKQIAQPITQEQSDRNLIIAKEIYLSVGRYFVYKRLRLIAKLLRTAKDAMRIGMDLSQPEQKDQVFDQVVFRVEYLDGDDTYLHGTSLVNLAKVKYSKDWTKIRGGKIATVFQDPMTSLNPSLLSVSRLPP